MKTNLDHEQSLELINEMIGRARNNFRKSHMATMIFWGYLISAIAIANFVLLHVLNNPNQSFMVWWVVIPGFLISFLIGRRSDRKAIVKTHIDGIMSTIWDGFAIGVFVFMAVIYLIAFQLNDYKILILITPVILVMLGVGQFSSARVCRYKPWYFSGILFWLGAIACTLVRQDFQFLIMAFCMMAGFVVPGHLLNRKKEINV